MTYLSCLHYPFIGPTSLDRMFQAQSMDLGLVVAQAVAVGSFCLIICSSVVDSVSPVYMYLRLKIDSAVQPL